ncbi:putative P450 monooxygenase [Lentithecium fluviatile CBS 122367]|uniref:Putative P450 monooxygenase n=1 Tax=Lentithecium fluviatile CBS 122367 TaxID=1168545 RepID=A0A6G1JHT5_9PLEO|nr:putative P450 monooxygenase [Lentithecium fluviatile CBS 122367]
MSVFSATNVAIGLVTLFAVHRIYWEATTGSRQRAIAKQHGCLPPKRRPGGGPCLGIGYLFENLKAFREHRICQAWTQLLRDENVHTMDISLLGQTILLTDDPENVKTMLTTDFNNWSLGSERIKMMTAFLGNGIFTNEGAAWKHSREMLRPCFERSMVADVSTFEKHTSRLFDILPRDSTTVDLQPLFHDLSMDIASDFLFGQSTDSLLDQKKENKLLWEFIESFEYCCNPSENDNKKWGVLVFFLPDPKVKRCAKTISVAFAQTIIEKQVELQSESTKEGSASSRYNFLDELLAATQDLAVIRSELLNVMLAGRDTIASLLSNAVWELSRQPEILLRLRGEIAEYIGDEMPTYELLKDMKYLRAITNETQRMYPVVPSNSRQALKDTVIPRGGGPDGTAPVLIPKGACVAYHSHAMHRRSDVFGDDADVFNPSRWLVGEHHSSPLRPGWSYIPFSGGPRVCIGQNFALTEAMFVIVRLLQTFNIESRDSEPWGEKLSISCTGINGCKVALRPRAHE